MPIARINATPNGLAPHDRQVTVHRLLADCAAPEGPAIIMLHGYKYAPGDARHCPHDKIFGASARAWPRQLGFGIDRGDEGLGVAFGWYARGPLRAAHARAGALGRTLASLVAMLKYERPGRSVHVIAHSMGSETALAALPHLPPHAIDRMVLMTGASFRGHAQRMLNTPAGRTVDLLNITSRENDLFDAAFERLVRPATPGDQALGRGIDASNATNLQLDCAPTLRCLHELGYPVGVPARRVCHWSAYRRPGIMALYADYLRTPERLPAERLKEALPATADPRWARLLAEPVGLKQAMEALLLNRLRTLKSLQPVWSTGLTGRRKDEPAC